MGDKVRTLLLQECFYYRTSLGWTVENGLVVDKCVLMMVEKGKANVVIGENEYVLDRHQMLFMRPELPFYIRFFRFFDGLSSFHDS